jgi:hypothetical protein
VVVGEDLGVAELLAEMHLQLVDGAQVLGAGDRRRVLHILHDRLELGLQVPVECLDEALLIHFFLPGGPHEKRR